MVAKPTNTTLYNKVKAEAKRKFKVWPSAYASGWLVQEYKRRGGTYSGKKPKNTGLDRWYKEKWVNVCTSPPRRCGRSGNISLSNWKKKYPYCRPSKRISSGTPKTYSELSNAEIQRRCKKKRRDPSKKVYKTNRRKSTKKKSTKKKSARKKSTKKKSTRKKSTRKKSTRKKSTRKKSTRKKSTKKKSTKKRKKSCKHGRKKSGGCKKKPGPKKR
jgi:hypothetical protein